MRDYLLVLACATGCGMEPFVFGDQTPPPIAGPDFGTTVTRTVAPPPISGGTLTVLAESQHAVAADPDRDRIYVVDLSARTKIADIPLDPGSEPGRVIEDGAGRVHVALRSAGTLVTLDPTTWTIAATRAVCPAPRGLAWDPATDLVHVACAGGELVSLPAAGGPATRSLQLDRDLRDVAVYGGQLWVTRFRTAEMLVLDASGQVVQRQSPPGIEDDALSSFTAAAAWRMVVTSDGLYVVHQRGLNGVVHTSPGGYGTGGACNDSIVHATVTHWTSGQAPEPGPVLGDAVVPVDIAVSTYAGDIAVVSAGNAKLAGAPTVVMTHTIGGGECDSGSPITLSEGIEPTAVAFTPGGTLLVQSREPARLVFAATQDTIELSSDSREDTGHAVFHANAGSGVACASCHLEGGDDGRTWTFDTSGLRRTQQLRGGMLGTEPFHWDGDEADFSHLAHDVFEQRMSGPKLTADQLAALGSWVDRIAVIAKAPGDAAAIARGKALFDDAQGAGCITCHNGPKLTNSAVVDVGTGGKFKVPRLVGVIESAPFLHDGAAATLADRFSAVGGDKHGKTSQLDAGQIADLVAYLGSL